MELLYMLYDLYIGVFIRIYLFAFVMFAICQWGTGQQLSQGRDEIRGSVQLLQQEIQSKDRAQGNHPPPPLLHPTNTELNGRARNSGCVMIWSMVC